MGKENKVTVINPCTSQASEIEIINILRERNIPDKEMITETKMFEKENRNSIKKHIF